MSGGGGGDWTRKARQRRPPSISSQAARLRGQASGAGGDAPVEAGSDDELRPTRRRARRESLRAAASDFDSGPVQHQTRRRRCRRARTGWSFGWSASSLAYPKPLSLGDVAVGLGRPFCPPTTTTTSTHRRLIRSVPASSFFLCLW